MPREPANPASLSGRVTRQSDDRPIAGAIVAITRPSELLIHPDDPTLVITDADGRWTARDLPPEDYAVTATADGFLPATRDAVISADVFQGLDLALEQGGTLLKGKVTDSRGGGPIVAAVVTARRDRGGPTGRGLTTRTAADGSYQLALRDGGYQLEFTHDDYSRAWQNVALEGMPVIADVELLRAGVIRGKVVARDSGKPVGDATIEAVGVREYSRARADADGSFTLRHLREGEVSIEARGRGFASAKPMTVDLEISQHIDGVQVIVDPAFNVAGRVVSNGKGVSGATLTARLIGGSSPLRSSLLDRISAPDPSEGDGTFEIPGLRPGKYLVAASKTGMLFGSGTELEVTNSDITELVVELRAGVTLSGRVEPPAVAQIGLAPAGDVSLNEAIEVNARLARTESDQRGAFTLQAVPAGKFEISVMTKEGISGRLPVTVEAVDQSGLVVRLSPRPSIAGRVIDTSGTPVAGVYVLASPLDVPFHKQYPGDGIIRGATSAANGTFKVVGLDGGRYQLTAFDEGQVGDSGGMKKLEVDVADNSDHTGVTLVVEARDGEIRGQVIAFDRKPAAGARVRAARVTSGPGFDFRREVQADSTGSFVIDQLRQGTYSLFAEGPRGKSSASRTGVRTGEAVTLTLVPPGTLTVRVTHEGSPVKKVSLLSCFGPPGEIPVGGEDLAGIHTFESVGPAEYRCEATADEGIANGSVTVRGGDAATLTLEVASYASLSGVAVSVLTGKPIAGIYAMARGSHAETDASGRFVLDRVPSGSGEVSFVPKDQITYGRETHLYTAKPGERVDIALVKILPLRVGDAGTLGFTTEIENGGVVVTNVKDGGAADRAGLKVRDAIATVDGRPVGELRAEFVQRLLASGNVGVGQVVTVGLARGAAISITAVKW